MTKYLPDTNILVYASKTVQPYSRLLNNWLNKGQIVISSIVVAEFLIGANPQETRPFLEVVDQLGTIPVDTAIAISAAGYRRTFRKPLADMLIAAQAKLLGATLVTNNRSDFPMSDIKILLK